MAGRVLIDETRILDAVRAGQTTLAFPRGALITPLARDSARQHGIVLLEGELPAAESAPLPSASAIVCIGSDHGGYDFKTEISAHLASEGWTIVDVGTDSKKSCDYPDFAYAVARMVADGRAGSGIMIDGAGIGSSIVCNKVPGIRAACAYNEFTAWNARAHNNANILTLGSRSLGIEVCKLITCRFLETAYEGGRHELRVAKISDIESKFSR